MLRTELAFETLGLIADTHCHTGKIPLPEAALAALDGVDLILALGDMGEPNALDQLAKVAPVLATRGGDDASDDPRYAAQGRLLVGKDLALAAAFELGQVLPGASS